MKNPDPARKKFIDVCDASFAVLACWQAVDALRPTMMIIMGIVLGAKTAMVFRQRWSHC
jgi:hypothetical protein